jgi:hypothetical protein
MANITFESPAYMNKEFKISKLKDGDTEVILKKALTADVTYDDKENLYYITFSDLNILVWGKDRSEAEDAFRFAFISLIQNIHNEDDKNLNKEAKEIKKKLSAIIDQIN